MALSGFRQAKRAAQYSSETGKLIDVFPSINAAAHQFGLAVHNILYSDSRNCRAGLYYWRVFAENETIIDVIDLPKSRRTRTFHAARRSHEAFGCNAKPVACYDSAGKLLRTYPSLSYATRQEGISIHAINRSIRIPHHSTGGGAAYQVGVYWRHVESEETAPREIEVVEYPTFVRTRARKKAKLDVRAAAKLNHVLIQCFPDGTPTGDEFANQIVAAKAVGVTRQMISLHMKHPEKNKTAGGFVWKLKHAS